MDARAQEVAACVWHVAASHTNFVLVRDGGSVTLIDTGYRGTGSCSSTPSGWQEGVLGTSPHCC